MKRLFLLLFLIFALLSPVSAANYYGRVTVTNAATQVFGGGAYKALAVQNQGATNVYCGPDSSVTTSNGPILLIQYSGYVYENGVDAVWCITGGASTTVGWYARTLSP